MERVAPVERSSEVIEIRVIGSATSFTLHANKQSLVSELKGQIASMVGITAQQRQRIIYGGKVLDDNELLSSYNIEDGHTVHLVVTTAPVQTISENLDAQPTAARNGEQGLLGDPRHFGGPRVHGGVTRRSARNIPQIRFRVVRGAPRRRRVHRSNNHHQEDDELMAELDALRVEYQNLLTLLKILANGGTNSSNTTNHD